MSFPQTVGALMQEGFESYAIDFRRAVATYYLPDGDSLQLPAHDTKTPIAERFDEGPIKAAISEAQHQADTVSCVKSTARRRCAEPRSCAA
jgi:hypothetical protein